MKQKKFIEKIITGIGSVPSLIAHTVLFGLAFVLSLYHAISWDVMLLTLTTIVSLEAIYLAIFIQMSVNRQTQELAEVSEDVDEIQKDVDEIQEDVDEIQKDVDEIQEDVEEITEETEEERIKARSINIEQLAQDLRKILADLEQLKNK